MASIFAVDMSFFARSMRVRRSGLVKVRAWAERMGSAAMAAGGSDSGCADETCAAEKAVVAATAVPAPRKPRRESTFLEVMILRGEHWSDVFL